MTEPQESVILICDLSAPDPYDADGHLIGCGECSHGERCRCGDEGLIR